MRNPKWHKDELILALDLYFQLEPGQIHARNSQIIELSDLLNRLPIHGKSGTTEKFRNPNGVGLKLSNFLALDDSYHGKGMTATSKLDREVFAEFKDNKLYLRQLAEAIRNASNKPSLNEAISTVNTNSENEEFSRTEGDILYRYHLYRERNSTLAKKKKEQALKAHGKLECELCSFDYAKIYGEAGEGFMECHHKIPLHLLVEKNKTTLNDLMLVCANCHRMLHRGWDSRNRSASEE